MARPQPRRQGERIQSSGRVAQGTHAEVESHRWPRRRLPAVVGDKLFVFVRQEGDEVTLCLNAATGKEVWRDKYAAKAASEPMGRHPGPRSSPTVAGGKVLTYGVQGILSCLDAETGKVLWRKDDAAWLGR